MEQIRMPRRVPERKCDLVVDIANEYSIAVDGACICGKRRALAYVVMVKPSLMSSLSWAVCLASDHFRSITGEISYIDGDCHAIP